MGTKKPSGYKGLAEQFKRSAKVFKKLAAKMETSNKNNTLLDRQIEEREKAEKQDTKIDFIQQTADDYFMTYEQVAYIYKNYQDTFYEELEDFIKDRAAESS